jgi:hypothetical protein
VGKNVAQLNGKLGLLDPAGGLHLGEEATQVLVGIGQFVKEHRPGDRLFVP